METAMLEGTLVSLMIGVGLSAACGFRIFIPFFVMNLAARAGYLELAGGWDWIGSTPALIAFGSATAFEIGAYYVPFLDNLLDTVSTPCAVIAGSLVTASQVSEMHPFFGWAVAIIAGGGAAGLVQGLTTITRQVSSFATGGFGNPIFSTFEAGASIFMTILAIFVPLLAALSLLFLIFYGLRRILLRRRRKTAEANALPA